MAVVDLDRRFARASVIWFERIFGLSLLVEVFEQIRSGVWRVHAGTLYPWRHIDLFPLLPPAVLAVEWALIGGASLTLIVASGPRVAAGSRFWRTARAAAWRALPFALLVSLLQRFSNHGSLMFMIALFVSMKPPELTLADFEAHAHPNLGLVRAQLVIVYVFSALAKVAHGFTSGSSLSNLLGLPVAVTRAASIGVVAIEFAVPLLVFWRPRLGLAAIALLHAGFVAAIPNVGSFGLAMFAMAALWVPPRS